MIFRPFLFVLLACGPAALAQHVDLSSPLDGYARGGCCVAVRIHAEGLGGAELTISGAGVTPTRIATYGGRVDAAIPLIWQGDPPAELHWVDGQSSGSAAFTARPLGVDERLIVVAGDLPDAGQLAAELFPGKKLTVVNAETARPRLLLPAMAYEAADAVLLDLAAAPRVNESQLRTFLAAGTTVAIRSAAKPTIPWPWRQQGTWWVLQHEVGGPSGGVNVDVYAPTYSWDRSWPEATRRNALLAAAAVAMLVAAATLWRAKWAVALAAAVCIGAAIGAALYGRGLTPAVTASGEIVVWDGAIAQHDRWTYLSAVRDANPSMAVGDGATKPVPGVRRLAEGMSFELVCANDGSPVRYDVHLPEKMTLAFLTRTVGTDAPTGERGPVRAPMGLFADKLYPGTMAGELPGKPAAAEEWWGTVVMRIAADVSRASRP